MQKTQLVISRNRVSHGHYRWPSRSLRLFVVNVTDFVHQPHVNVDLDHSSGSLQEFYSVNQLNSKLTTFLQSADTDIDSITCFALSNL